MRLESTHSSTRTGRRLPFMSQGRSLVARRASTGASAVELAVLLPFIMAILFGIIEWGFLLYDKAMITNAAREGARFGIVLTPALPACPPGTRKTTAEIQARALAYCSGKTIAIVGGGTCLATVTRPACPQFGNQLTVRVDYTYNGTALLRLYQIMAGPITLSSTATMVYE